MKYLKKYEIFGSDISENLKYHLDNSKPITENIFRPGSDAFYDVIKEARNLFDSKSINYQRLLKVRLKYQWVFITD